MSVTDKAELDFVRCVLWELNASEPLKTCRNGKDVIKTGEWLEPWDKWSGDLCTGFTVADVKGQDPSTGSGVERGNLRCNVKGTGEAEDPTDLTYQCTARDRGSSSSEEAA